MKLSKQAKWSFFILSAACILLGLCFVMFPGTSAEVLGMLFGVLIVVLGILKIVFFFRGEYFGFPLPGELAFGVLDVRMPNMSGLELQNKLKEIGCDLPIVFVSGHADIDMAVNAVKNGAFDFLEKPAKESRLIDVIEAAVARNKANRRDQAEVADFKARLEQLTQREREVIRMVAQGYSNKEVAAEFGISEKTVQVHRGSAYRKLELHNAAEIARLLLLSGDPL